MLRIGEIVETNYGTGPYRITHIFGPCTCGKNGDDPPSDPHYHLTCARAGPNDRASRNAGAYWLNGYRSDGTSVWGEDKLIFEGVAQGATPDLFTIT